MMGVFVCMHLELYFFFELSICMENFKNGEKTAEIM